MKGPGKARCGIDLGSSVVRLVRGEGKARLNRLTHIGQAKVDPEGSGDAAERTANALRGVLSDLGLTGGRLGRTAVAVRGEGTRVREVVMTRLTEAELRQALPFEARKHLDLDGLSSPVLDAQIMGAVDPSGEGNGRGQENGRTGTSSGAGGQIRVLLAAAASEARNFALQVLDRAGLEPEVVDLEALANLNALLAHIPHGRLEGHAACLLILEERRCDIHLSQRQGGFLTRSIELPLPPFDALEAVTDYTRRLVPMIAETLTFYRGRYRREVRCIYLGGGGAFLPGLKYTLSDKTELPVEVLDPLSGLADSARGYEQMAGLGPQFVTACGLCRWWDHADV